MLERPGKEPKRFQLDPDVQALTADVPTLLAPGIPANAREKARNTLKQDGKVKARVRVTAEGPGDQQRQRLRRTRIER